MMKKLMSLGLVGILSASLMVGCSSNDSKDDDTVTIKYVDENGNVVKKDHVTKEEAKEIERKQQTTTKEQPSKKETTKEHKQQTSKQHEDTTDTDDGNYDKELYGNALLDTCPDCGRSAMIFNNDQGLKCGYCGFYDPYYYLPEEPDQNINDDNKEDDDYTPEDNSDDYDYEEPETDNDVEESPSETIEQN